MQGKSLSRLTAVVLSTSAMFSYAAPSEQSWHAFNRAVVNEHVMPQYQQLDQSSQALKAQLEQLCKKPNEHNLQASQQAFVQTLGHWQGVQHIIFGPIENYMRNFSMQFWPDKKNLTSKQLNNLLKAQDKAMLDPSQLRSASIAVKGLPALERLLFADNAISLYKKQPYRCQLSHAVASHIAVMSHETFDEWKSYQKEFTQLDGNGYYEDATEASTELLKALVEPVEVIRDLKILRPLGKSFAKAKPRRAESWRSRHSISNVIINLSSLKNLYNTGGKYSARSLLTQQGKAKLANAIDHNFTTIIQQLNQLPSTMNATLSSPESYQQLQTISAELKTLHAALTTAMKPLDITLGFNSRDGD